MTVGTGKLLKLDGDYDLFNKTERAQRTRVPIETKLGVQDMETFRMIQMSVRNKCQGPGYSENSDIKDSKEPVIMKSQVLKTAHQVAPRKHFVQNLM